MKHKGMKIALIIAISALAAGGILLGAGLCLGGSPSFYIDGDGIHVKENTTAAPKEDYVMKPVKTGTIRKLDLSLLDADVQIVSGDVWSVEYCLDSEHLEPVYGFADGVLTLKEGEYDHSRNAAATFGIGDDWWGQEEDYSAPYVKITVPENGKLEEAVISSRYGNVEIERTLYATDARITAENGDIRLEGWKGSGLELQLKYGSLVSGALEGARVKADSENGDLKIGSLNADAADLKTEYGNLTAEVEKADNVDVESKDGSVTLYLDKEMDRYGVNLHTDGGTIRTPEGTVEADGEEGGSDFIRSQQDVAGLRVCTDYGDIRIREKS